MEVPSYPVEWTQDALYALVALLQTLGLHLVFEVEVEDGVTRIMDVLRGPALPTPTPELTLEMVGTPTPIPPTPTPDLWPGYPTPEAQALLPERALPVAAALGLVTLLLWTVRRGERHATDGASAPGEE